MKNLHSVAAFFLVCILAVLDGCTVSVPVSSNSAGMPVSSGIPVLTGATSAVVSVTLGLAQNAAQRTKIANAIYLGATALRSIDPVKPLSAADFQTSLKDLMPDGSASDLAQYSGLATSISGLYGSLVLPKLSTNLKTNIAIIEQFATALENAAEPWITKSSWMRTQESRDEDVMARLFIALNWNLKVV